MVALALALALALAMSRTHGRAAVPSATPLRLRMGLR
jgi:hypothetical protein